MAALLVAMAVMAVLMSAALPVWRHDAQREKEEELVWRGQQYMRAIRLFHSRTQTFPSSIDMLVQGRYLRKKFKDPVTGEDFVPVPAAGAIPGQGGQTAGGGRTGASGPGQTGVPAPGLGSSRGGAGSGTGSAFASTTVPGGMMGVVSKSKAESIRLYQGRNHYNEWTFLYVNQQPGGPGGPGGRGGPDGRGGRGRADGSGTNPFGGSTTNPFGGPGGPGSGPGDPGSGPRGRPGGPGVGPRGTPFPVPGGVGRGRGSQ